MRCVFCKRDSRSSRSVEHIIPESLGGISHKLPPGVVCDGCNNYFSREVEKPFLESEVIALLRFRQNIPNKKGRVPPIPGILLPGPIPVSVYRYEKSESDIAVDVPPEAAQCVSTIPRARLIVGSDSELPTGPIISRFMAKIALEAMAARLLDHSAGLEYIVDEGQLDPIRNHARRGETRHWPVYARQIYHPDEKWIDEHGSALQIMNEHDILVTENGEWYFVLALFGKELSINYGGPETEGYKLWLDEHENRSSLYSGKNASGGGRLKRCL